MRPAVRLRPVPLETRAAACGVDATSGVASVCLAVAVTGPPRLKVDRTAYAARPLAGLADVGCARHALVEDTEDARGPLPVSKACHDFRCPDRIAGMKPITPVWRYQCLGHFPCSMHK